MNVKSQSRGRRFRQLVTGAAWVVIAGSTALGADCWTTSQQLCCQSFWIMCKYVQGEQTLKWWCPQLSDTRGMTVKSVVPAAKGVKGRTNVDDPSIVGKCKRTRTKCGELPNECIVTSVDEVVCSSTGVKGDNCTGE